MGNYFSNFFHKKELPPPVLAPEISQNEGVMAQIKSLMSLYENSPPDIQKQVTKFLKDISGGFIGPDQIKTLSQMLNAGQMLTDGQSFGKRRRRRSHRKSKVIKHIRSRRTRRKRSNIKKLRSGKKTSKVSKRKRRSRS